MIPDITPAAIGIGTAGLLAAFVKLSHSLFLGFLHAASHAPAVASMAIPPGPSDQSGDEDDEDSDMGKIVPRATLPTSPRAAIDERLPDIPAVLLAEADRVCDFHAALARGCKVDPLALDPLIERKEPKEKRLLEWCARLGFREGMEVRS